MRSDSKAVILRSGTVGLSLHRDLLDLVSVMRFFCLVYITLRAGRLEVPTMCYVNQ